MPRVYGHQEPMAKSLERRLVREMRDLTQWDGEYAVGWLDTQYGCEMERLGIGREEFTTNRWLVTEINDGGERLVVTHKFTDFTLPVFVHPNDLIPLS